VLTPRGLRRSRSTPISSSKPVPAGSAQVRDAKLRRALVKFQGFTHG